ncbi:hypothetical protein [Bartonella sp. DGB1]|uniref:hypothetical protein n=1 Tax=Bartonella sp. DGB1 TaxID=3239807 RepID=UPI0035251E7E
MTNVTESDIELIVKCVIEDVNKHRKTKKQACPGLRPLTILLNRFTDGLLISIFVTVVQLSVHYYNLGQFDNNLVIMFIILICLGLISAVIKDLSKVGYKRKINSIEMQENWRDTWERIKREHEKC